MKCKPIEQVNYLAGHKLMAMTKRYDHANEERYGEAIEALDEAGKTGSTRGVIQEGSSATTIPANQEPSASVAPRNRHTIENQLLEKINSASGTCAQYMSLAALSSVLENIGVAVGVQESIITT